jgi:hypothetical protein
VCCLFVCLFVFAWCMVYGAAADKKLLVQPESRIDVPSVAVVYNDGVQSKFN